MQIHVSLVPLVGGEQKTKPTQQAIKDVRSAGLVPDLVRLHDIPKYVSTDLESRSHVVARSRFCQLLW